MSVETLIHTPARLPDSLSFIAHLLLCGVVERTTAFATPSASRRRRCGPYPRSTITNGDRGHDPCLLGFASERGQGRPAGFCRPAERTLDGVERRIRSGMAEYAA